MGSQHDVDDDDNLTTSRGLICNTSVASEITANGITPRRRFARRDWESRWLKRILLMAIISVRDNGSVPHLSSDPEGFFFGGGCLLIGNSSKMNPVCSQEAGSGQEEAKHIRKSTSIKV